MRATHLLRSVVIALAAASVGGPATLGATLDCQWTPIPAKTGRGFPDPHTLYYAYNAPFKSGVTYEVSDAAMPTSSYFSVTAYANGLPNGGGKLADYEIQALNNPYPAPGANAVAPLGQSGPYRIAIGDKVARSPTQPNVIKLVEKNFVYPIGAPRPAQVELFLRHYGPLPSGIKPPRLRLLDQATGQQLACPASAETYIDYIGLLAAGQALPPATKHKEELLFPWTEGSTLYPDHDGYLSTGWTSSGIALIAAPRPDHPPCVSGSGSCFLDRSNGPGYSSFVIGDQFTKTVDSLTDRWMPGDPGDTMYIAILNDKMQQNLPVVTALMELGYTIRRSADLGASVLVYRQKLPPNSGYVDSFRMIPRVEGCLAAAYIAASPVGVFCAAPTSTSDTSSVQCINQSKTQLTALRRRYDSIRQQPPAVPVPTTCACRATDCPR